jgi:hypothetical protein
MEQFQVIENGQIEKDFDAIEAKISTGERNIDGALSILENVSDEFHINSPALREMQRRGGLFYEKWSKTVSIPAKILNINKEFFTCECVVDRQNFIFESRVFPTKLIAHIDDIERNNLILIKVKEKPGSTRIDIYDGRGTVDSEIFSVEEELNELDNLDLGKPFSL